MNRDSLTQFLYLLMRDYLPTGSVESIMNQVRACKGKEVTHSAPNLESYATSLADEIRATGETEVARGD